MSACAFSVIRLASALWSTSTRVTPSKRWRRSTARESRSVCNCLLWKGKQGLGTWGRYHGGRRPSSDDSFHSPTVIPPSALDKPSIMKRYHRRRTTRLGVTARSPTMVTLHDTRFVEFRWWNHGWTVKTVDTWRSSASMIPAPGCGFPSCSVYVCIRDCHWCRCQNRYPSFSPLRSPPPHPPSPPLPFFFYPLATLDFTGKNDRKRIVFPFPLTWYQCACVCVRACVRVCVCVCVCV